MSSMGQQLFQHVSGPQFQAAGTVAGMTAYKFSFINLPFHQKPHPMLRIVHKAQDGCGTGRAVQKLPQCVLRGEGEAGGTNLMGEVLGVKRLAGAHAQQVELCLLAVAEEEVFADGHTQHFADGGALLHGVGGFAGDPAVFDSQLLTTFFQVTVKGAGGKWLSVPDQNVFTVRV